MERTVKDDTSFEKRNPAASNGGTTNGKAPPAASNGGTTNGTAPPAASNGVTTNGTTPHKVGEWLHETLKKMERDEKDGTGISVDTDGDGMEEEDIKERIEEILSKYPEIIEEVYSTYPEIIGNFVVWLSNKVPPEVVVRFVLSTLERFNKRVADLKEKLADAEKRLSEQQHQCEEEKKDLRNRNKELEDEILQLRREMQGMNEKHSMKVQEMRVDFSTKIEQLKEAYQSKIDQQRNAHESKIEQLKEAYQSKIDQQRNAHESKIMQLNETHTSKVNDLQEKIRNLQANDLEKEIAIKNELRTEFKKMEGYYKEKIDTLEKALYSNQGLGAKRSGDDDAPGSVKRCKKEK